MMIDSLDLDDDGRAQIVARARGRRRERAIVDHARHRHHGRDRARARRSRPDGRPIVLTGAMVPYAFGSSDGLFNLGSALSFVQVLPPGVYVAMNGQHFDWDGVRKNTRERLLRGVRRMIRLESQAAVGRHDDLHRDVAAGGRSSARSTCRRAFPTSTAIPRWSTRSPRHMRERPQPVRADAGRAGAARGDRREVRRRSTADATIPTPKSRSPPAAPRRSSMPSPRSSARATKSIVLEPCYDSLRAGDRAERRHAGVRAAALPGLRASTGTRCARAVTPRTRLIMINSPHNPTGAMLTRRRHRAS